ncbi:MAG: thioester domain-containing protein, partial [Clostridia bacterium]|nr:thioester domain-containing protein [Clostridia bacterium]
MTKLFNKFIACLVAFGLIGGYIMPFLSAAEITDEAVLAVIDQLTAIDTLQTIQDKRATYTASGHYDITTTSQKVIDRHNKARTGYETYVALAFSARLAAQQAYDALTPEQQAQIDPALVAKLDNKLDTVFHTATFPVTPADNEYTFEAVDGGLGYGYEVSNHMVSSNIPQTFVLVNTADGATSWTPNGRYEYGKSNYDVAYCCDVQTNLSYGSHYKRINLEDSAYYSSASAKHIRAIVMNSYPFVSMDEMKAILKADGMNGEFVDSLTRADMIAAVQQAIWTYANAGEEWNNVGYFASIDVPRNNGIYFTALHDYTNECWEWFPGSRTRSYRADAAYRVNNLAYYLCTLEGYDAAEGEIIITDVDVTRASLLADADDTYELGMYVHLNTGAAEGDNLTITVISRDADGNITGKSGHAVESAKTYELGVTARFGDTITVSVEGTQRVGRSVYFYEPEGGRDTSQCLVGVGGGPTRVRAEETFVFNTDIEQGIRIYKTDSDTGLPISEITFDVYRVTLSEGETVGETPTEDEIAKYVTDSSKVGSLTTDTTGYASFPLEKGVYIVVERHNADKVEAPIGPFCVSVPMRVETSDPVTGVTVEH